jgi:hypothetical protein
MCFSVADRVVFLMRGLPSCGKSHRARELAGATGVVCETDEFFHTQVGNTIERYSYDADRQTEARDWNFGRFTDAVDAGVSSVVVDRGNGLNLETQRYARYATSRGYTVLFAEADSPWWQEIRVLLKYKQHTMPVLEEWAEKLATKNRSTHRTPAKTILRWMKNWRVDVTVEKIMEFEESRTEPREFVDPSLTIGYDEERNNTFGSDASPHDDSANMGCSRGAPPRHDSLIKT